MKFNLSKIKFSKSDINKKLILPKEISCDLAEEIGLHVGDGSMNFYSNKGIYQLRGHIEDDKKHYKTRILELYKKLYNLDLNIRKMESTGVLGFQIWSNALVEFKNKIIGLPLGKKTNIVVPKVINNKKLFRSFLRGFFDTDGSVYIENKRGKSYPRIEMKTTSKSLCLQIVKFLKKDSINVTHYEYKRKEKNWNNLYSIMIRGFPSVTEWIKKISSNNPKHIEKLKKMGLL